MLREIFAPKWEEVTEYWRKLQIGELCDFFSRHYGDISEDEMDGEYEFCD
jgi:hypothetical protein